MLKCNISNTINFWNVDGIMNASDLLHNFWNVHGIMNASGLLQETKSIHDSMNIPKIEVVS